MNNTHILLISQSGSYRVAAFLDAAKAMGINALIASTDEHSVITEVKEGLHINLSDFTFSLEVIHQAHLKYAFSGIIGTDDSTVELATLAAQDLDLIHNPIYSAKLTQRKDLARQCLSKNQCVVPEHQLINLSQPLENQPSDLSWPCVIKPLNMSASRGVIRVNDLSEFLVACGRVAKIIAISDDPFERNHVLLEKYIEGVEIAFEGYLQDGQLHQLAIFDKPNPLIGPYFEETIYVTPSQLSDSIQTHIKQRVLEACQAYGLMTGPIHAELRVDADNEAWILEVANRSIGGDCGRTLDGPVKYFIEKLIISLAIGKSISNQDTTVNQTLSTGVMMIPIHRGGILQKILGVEEAELIDGVTGVKININTGHELIPLPEGNQYLGYIFAEGNTPNQVIDTLNKAYNTLSFKVTRKINLFQNQI